MEPFWVSHLLFLLRAWLGSYLYTHIHANIRKAALILSTLIYEKQGALYNERLASALDLPSV